jgi:ADP-ribose pyrophosphatase YjhB (NUDIX family)
MRYYARDPRVVRLSVSAVVWRASGSREVLLMQRRDNGHWGLPGGYVDPGESVVQAAVREVLEETGYRVEIGRLIGVYSDPARQVVAYADGEVVQAVNLCFEGLALEAGAPTTPDETLATGFFALDALPQPFVPIQEIRIADAVAGEPGARVR